MRQSVSVLSTAWRTLTDIERSSWISATNSLGLKNTLGADKHLTGHQYFVGLNLPRLREGLSVLSSAPENLVGAEPVALTVFSSPGVVQVAGPAIGADDRIIIEASRCISQGATPKDNMFRYMTAAGSFSVGITGQYLAAWGTPQPGLLLWIRYRTWTSRTFLSPWQYAKCTVVYDAVVTNYQSAVIGQGSTVSPQTLLSLQRFYSRLVNAGIWNLIDEIYTYTGSSLAGALVKFKNLPAGGQYLTNHNFLAGDYNERGALGGLNGNGTTKYLDTNLPGTSLKLLGHMCAYRRDASPGSLESVPIGVVTVSNAFTLITSVPGTDSWAVWGENVQTLPHSTLAPGLWAVDRALSNLMVLRLNAKVKTGSFVAVSASLVAYNVYAWAGNNTNVVGGFCAGRQSYHSVGATLNDAQWSLYYGAIQDLQTELGRAV